MTSVRKFCCKKSLRKNKGFVSFWILGCQRQGPTLYGTTRPNVSNLELKIVIPSTLNEHTVQIYAI
jgi:hypothetical protein